MFIIIFTLHLFIIQQNFVIFLFLFCFILFGYVLGFLTNLDIENKVLWVKMIGVMLCLGLVSDQGDEAVLVIRKSKSSLVAQRDKLLVRAVGCVSINPTVECLDVQ